MKPSSVTELASLISRSLISTSHSRHPVQWTQALEQTLHRLHFRESLSPMLVAMIIDPHLLQYPSLSLGFFNWASQQHNFSHSSLSYHSVLKSLTASHQFGALEKVLRQARSHGIPIDPFIYGSVIDSRVKAGQIMEAFQLFTEVAPFIKDVGSGSCNSLLAALASHGYVDYATKVFDEMLVRCVSFSTLGFGVFIWRFCKDAIFERVLDLWAKVRQGIFEINDSIVVVLLIHGLCQAGRVLDAQSALEELRNRGCKPDFMAYRVLAVGLRSMGYLAEVEVVLKKKRKLGVAPRSNDYREFIFSLISEGRIELAKQLGRVIVDGDFPIEDDVLNALASSVSTIDPSSALFFLQYMIGKERMPTLLALSNFGKNLCDHGKTDELVEILQKLSSYGYFNDLEAYNVMVSLLCNAGKVKEAYKVLQEMSKNGLNPDITLYNDLMDALCRDDLLRPARKLWDEMFASGINGNMQTYTILIKKFSEVGQFEEALVLFNHMLEKGLTPDALTYRSLLESLIQDGKVEPATQLFQKTVEQDQNLPGMLLTPLLISLCKGGHFLSGSRFLCALNYNGVLVQPHVILLKCLADAGQIPLAVEHIKQIKINSAMLLQTISSELFSLVSSSPNPDPILQLLQEIYVNNIIPVNDGWKELSCNWFT
ncbi:hypothetical protein V2J09_021902 [Rumex salicifolius]